MPTRSVPLSMIRVATGASAAVAAIGARIIDTTRTIANSVIFFIAPPEIQWVTGYPGVDPAERI